MREICIAGSGFHFDYSHYKNSILRRGSYSRYYNLLFSKPRSSYRHIGLFYFMVSPGTQLKICKVS